MGTFVSKVGGESENTNTKERIGVYGGAFDPFHKGHLAVAITAYQQLGLDKVLLVPVFDPAHKAGTLFEYQARVEMLKLATAQHPYLEISTIESQLPKPSYTSRTLEALHNESTETPAELTLILGEDAFLTLPSWHQWLKLQTLCKIAVFPRAGTQNPASRKERKHEIPATWLDAPEWPLASSSIKSMLQQGQSIDDMVPLEIARWIQAYEKAAPNRSI